MKILVGPQDGIDQGDPFAVVRPLIRHSVAEALEPVVWGSASPAPFLPALAMHLSAGAAKATEDARSQRIHRSPVPESIVTGPSSQGAGSRETSLCHDRKCQDQASMSSQEHILPGHEPMPSQQPATSAPVDAAFRGKKATRMRLDDYVQRLARYGKISPGSFAHAALLIRRLVEIHKLTLDTGNVHRLLLAAATIATKLHDDFSYTAAHYARVGGVATADLVAMEMKLVDLLNFHIHVEVEEIEAVVDEVMLVWRQSCD